MIGRFEKGKLGGNSPYISNCFYYSYAIFLTKQPLTKVLVHSYLRQIAKYLRYLE